MSKNKKAPPKGGSNAVGAFIALAAALAVVVVGTLLASADSNTTKTKPAASNNPTTAATTQPAPTTSKSQSGGKKKHRTSSTPSTTSPKNKNHDGSASDAGSAVDTGKIDPGSNVGSIYVAPPDTCKVSLQKLHFYAQDDGKLGPNNFGKSPVFDLSDPAAGTSLVGLMEDDSCRDPVRMVADMVAAGFIPKAMSENDLNGWVQALIDNPKLWQDFHNRLVKHHKDIHYTKLTTKPPEAVVNTMEMSKSPDGKSPPWLGFTQTPNSCTHFLWVVYKDGRIEVFCVECRIQPAWTTTPPPPPPPSVATPPSTPGSPPTTTPGSPPTTSPPNSPPTTAPPVTSPPDTSPPPTNPPPPPTTAPPPPTTAPPTTQPPPPPPVCPVGPLQGQPAPGGNIENCPKSIPGSTGGYIPPGNG